jgi:hypothetical protein
MEKNQLQQVVNNQQTAGASSSLLTLSSKTLADKLLPSEKLIVDMKYAMPRIGAMNGIDQSTHAAGLMIRIQAAMGWNLPDSDMTMTALTNEFRQYVIESCSDMTPEEVAYSIRTYGVGVKEWGKNLNLALIDQCVTEYRNERSRLSEVERMASQTQGVAEKESLGAGPVDWSDKWIEVLESAKNGQINKVIIPAVLYDWLESRGMVKGEETENIYKPGITDEQKKEIMLHVTGLYVAELENVVLNGAPHIESLYECKKRLHFLKTDNTAWSKYLPLKATLTNLAKIETVRQLAMMYAKIEGYGSEEL